MRSIQTHTHDMGGVTLIELLVMSVIASLVAITVIQGFSGISRGVISTRFKSLATQLAHEKMQSLKSTSYYRLRVSSQTTVPIELTALSPSVQSDALNYPPQVSVINGVPFTAYAMVERVKKNNAETLEPIAWNAMDTGLKKITLNMVWKENGFLKRFQLVNLLENPDRQAAQGDFIGTVTIFGTATPIIDAIVDIAENPTLTTRSDSLGHYRLGASLGTYTLRASKPGFFTESVGNKVLSSTAPEVTVNLQPVAMASGTVSGSVWKNDHLVISRIAGEVSAPFGWTPAKQEYVEIFNPTTWTWTVDGQIGLTFQRQLVQDPLPIPISIDYSPGGASIAPGGFYLFGSTSILNVGGVVVSVDAKWNSTLGMGDPCDLVEVINDNCFPYFDSATKDFNVIPIYSVDSPNEGTGVLTLYIKGTGAVIDRVGWKGAGGGGIPASSEGTPLSAGTGLKKNYILYRFSDVGGAFSSTIGPAYDSGDNDNDFESYSPLLDPPPRCTASSALPVKSGVPADGALVFADDGLSQMTQATIVGSPPEARFTLSSIATGTWTVSASSGNLYASLSAPVSAGVALSTSIVLNTSTPFGFASGKVVNAISLSGIPGIEISPPGSTFTNGAGLFNIPLYPGAQTLTANAGLVNPNYTETSVPITIVLGQTSSNNILYLNQGVKIEGRVTIDGVTPLPNVPIEIKNIGTGVVTDDAISNINGLFSVSVPVGTYAVQPTVAYGETVSPDTSNLDANAGGTTVFAATYTVSSAYGTLQGKVTRQGKPISTGVLLVASAVAVPATPPDINSSFRGSSTLYYSGSSRSDGTYSFSVKNGTYTVSAWYTMFNGDTPSVVRKDQPSVQILPRNVTTLDLSW